MQLKASTDYALRAVIYLAMQDHVISSKKIADELSIPRDYLIQLSQNLRNAGIIEAKAGKTGGYLLAKPASSITAYDIIKAIDDPVIQTKDVVIHDADASSQDAQANNQVIYGIHKALELMSHGMDAYLDSVTVETLVKCAQDSEHAEDYLAQLLSGDGASKMADATTKERIRHSAGGVIQAPDSVTVIPVELYAAPAVASASDIPQVESKTPTADIDWKIPHAEE